MDKRVTVRTVSGQQKLCPLPRGASMTEFLAIASKKLDIEGKRLFTHPGHVEVDDLDLVRDDDVLVVTDGGVPGGKKSKKGVEGGQRQQFKLAVIGSGGVGKSALTLQYVQGRFIVVYDPTIEDAYRKQTVIDNVSCFLDILDTAGQEDYVALRGQWMQEREGFVLVYSVADRRTFENLDEFYNQLLQIHETAPPLIIVGNKVDVPVSEVQVTRAEGEHLAKSYGGAIFMETSAKTGHNVEKAFAAVVREIRKRTAPTAQTRKSYCTLL